MDGVVSKVETAELEIKEMTFEHDQLNHKLGVANKHVPLGLQCNGIQVR